MEEQTDYAFVKGHRLTIIKGLLQPGGVAPDFLLDYLDLTEMTIQSACLADLPGTIRLLNVVNSLESPTCHRVTLRWEKQSATLPIDACLYTVSQDPPLAQARWQAATGVMHQVLSAYGHVQFARDYGVLLKGWNMLRQAVFVIDQDNHIVYIEYVADQVGEPDYGAAIRAARRRAFGQGRR